ncbi:MAG: putative 5-nucleotidase [Marmoricola sp.]|nr:putative 5-nucleotidase [Marmoricola sp.]
MKFRPYVVAVAALATAAFSIAVVAPADAAATDPVTGLAVNQVQVGSALKVSASWTANADASAYRVTITDQADGHGDVLAIRDTKATSAEITTDALAPGESYWVAVRSTAPAATLVTKPFTAITLDTEGPTGTFTLNRTSAYILFDFDSPNDDPGSADFVLTQTALTDGTTAASGIHREVILGNGTEAKAWTSGSTFTLRYPDPGTFEPKVRLTDEFGNSRIVELPDITAKADLTNPKVRITVPAKATKIASWKHIKGTATDTGTGVDTALAFVVQKRGTVWYAYDFPTKKWLKGYTDLDKTLARSEANAAEMVPNSSGVWQSPAIAGLREGKLHVEAVAFDKYYNVGFAPVINRTLT